MELCTSNLFGGDNRPSMETNRDPQEKIKVIKRSKISLKLKLKVNWISENKSGLSLDITIILN